MRAVGNKLMDLGSLRELCYLKGSELAAMKVASIQDVWCSLANESKASMETQEQMVD